MKRSHIVGSFISAMGSIGLTPFSAIEAVTNHVERTRFPKGRGFAGMSKRSISHAAQKRLAAKRRSQKARSSKRK